MYCEGERNWDSVTCYSCGLAFVDPEVNVLQLEILFLFDTVGGCSRKLQHQPWRGQEDVQPQLRPDGQWSQRGRQKRGAGAGSQEQL